MEFQWLESARLRFRMLNQDVYRYAFQHLSGQELMEFFGAPDEASLERERAKSEGGLVTYRSKICYFHLIDKNTGTVLGSCGFHNWFAEHRRAELGYALTSSEHRGSGLMTEALEVVLAYGFNEMNLNRVEAFIGKDNEPSLRLVKRFGFQPEGCLRQHWNHEGALVDSLVFGLLQEEWQANRALASGLADISANK
jgi:ribosomal-protein-alanine N-acetyltransferase